MATFLDISLLEGVSGVFTWLIVWVVVFGVLEAKSPFGKGKEGLNAIVAVGLAFLVVLSGPASDIVSFLVPWMTVLIIAFFLIILSFMAFGADMGWVEKWFDKTGKGWAMTLAIIIAIFALSGALGGSDEPAQQYVSPNDSYGYQGQVPGQTVPGQYQQGYYPEQGQGYQQEYQQAYQNGPPQVQQKQSFGEKLVSIFIHPTFLGVAFILLFANFTIVFLSKME